MFGALFSFTVSLKVALKIVTYSNTNAKKLGFTCKKQKLLVMGMVIRVDGSCSYRVNIQIMLIFVNSNSTQLINVSIFINSNPTHLLIIRIRLVNINMTHLILLFKIIKIIINYPYMFNINNLLNLTCLLILLVKLIRTIINNLYLI